MPLQHINGVTVPVCDVCHRKQWPHKTWSAIQQEVRAPGFAQSLRPCNNATRAPLCGLCLCCVVGQHLGDEYAALPRKPRGPSVLAADAGTASAKPIHTWEDACAFHEMCMKTAPLVSHWPRSAQG